MTQVLRDNEIRMLHVRFDGRGEETSYAALNLDLQATDFQIKQAAASYFDRPAGYFDGYTVVRHKDSTVLRPAAIYG